MFAGSSTILTANSTFSSPPRVADRYDSISGVVFADQAGTLFIEQSSDPRAADVLTASSANWDVSTSYAISASDGKGFVEALVAPYWRIRYLNGGSDQGAFRISARTTASGDS